MKKIEDLIINTESVGVLETLVQLQQIEDELTESLNLIKSFKEEHLEEIVRDAEAYGGTFGGYEIKQRSGRRILSYKNIAEYVEAKNQLKSIEDKYKAVLESKLKGLINVNEDGEEMEVPSVSYAKSSLTIKKI